MTTFAYGGRKPSIANYTPRQNRNSIIQRIRRRVRLRTVLVGASVTVLLYLVISWLSSSLATESSSLGDKPPFIAAPAGEPNVVLVTVMNDERGELYNAAIKTNRREYAKKHGYAFFLPSNKDYTVGDSPQTWTKVPAMRHAMTQFPKTPYLFYIDDHTLIANPNIALEQHLTDGDRIESLAITDIPVVPPDSVIKTMTGVSGNQVDLLLVQDKEGLSVNSFVLRSGDWAKYFLDTWFDPLYRHYNFQKAERHALEHIVQWHGTLLAKLALVPQHTMASYTELDKNLATDDGIYEADNFVISFADCDSPNRNCKEELRPWFQKLHGIDI